MIIDYRLKWNRDWLIANCANSRYAEYVSSMERREGKPVLTPTGRIKAHSYTFWVVIEDQEHHNELMDWLHYEAGFTGHWVFMTEKGDMHGVLAVATERDAMMTKMRLGIEEQISKGSGSRILRHFRRR